MVLGYVSKKPYKEWESFMKIFRVFTTTDRLDPSLLKRSLILWDSFMMKLNTMLRNNIQCTILTTKFILHMFTLLPPFFSLSSSSSSSSSFFFFFSFFFIIFFLLWRWLSHQFQSLSTATVLFRSTFTRTIILIQPTYESSYRKVCNWKTNWAEWN